VAISATPAPIPSTPQRIRGPKADCVFGMSGSTKTTQVGRMAEYVYDKYGQRTRLVTADPGGFQAIEHLVEVGIVEPYQLNTSQKYPLEELVRLAQGWWPDGTGKLVRGSLEGIGAYAFEGMTTFSTLLMTNLVKREDIHIPETPKESFVKDGELRWGFSGRAHYGFIQQRIYEIVSTSNHLPVHKILWTSHVTDAKDNQQQKIYGHYIIGEAMTASCGAWFGAMLHLFSTPQEVEVADPVNAGKKIKVVRRVPMMYLREHVDPNDPYRIPYMCKTRGPYTLYKEWPDYMEPDLYAFYTKLDELSARAVAEIKAKQQKSTGGTA
jgi:hypothetical protein